MKTKDYELILDAMHMTGVYVIREDNHQILYFNKRVKEAVPKIEIGMVCHELWENSCSNCPLLKIQNKKEICSVQYDDFFEEIVDRNVTRILWEDKIPAFIIMVIIHEKIGKIHQEINNQEVNGQEINNQKVDNQEINNQEVNSEEINNQEINSQEIQSKFQKVEASRRDNEKDYLISCLSSMFFATYYIDLEAATFRAVKQRKGVGELLGDEIDFAKGISAYAQNFVHPDDRQEYIEKMNCQNLINILSQKHPLTAVEYRRIAGKDGKALKQDGWIRASIVLAEEVDGRPKTALYVAQDITESKQKEEQEYQKLLKARNEANQANESKSDFLSKMSHDIRTPMNAIIGMTAIALAHLDDSERVMDCLNKITISSKHLLSLINEVLDMSKIESGKIDLTEEEFNLSDLVDNLLTMIRPSIVQKNHELEVRIKRVQHEDVIGDVLRLQQVFMNFMGNAVKYTPDGGKLELEISEEESSLEEYGCYHFVFRDNGIGMDEEYQKKIFEPFSRAEDKRISKIEGTGLGMSIAQNIVRMMKGNIQVKSEIGKGTEFTVTVFLKQQNKAAVDLEKLKNNSIMMVDDDIASCEAVCAVLEDIGLKGEWQLCGKDAVERICEVQKQGRNFFAVILDWKMPEMDGIETAKAIREKVGAKVPIIILSAYDWSVVEAQARQAGVDDFISKPLFKSRLIYLLKKIAGEENRKEEIEKPPQQSFEGKRILLVEDNELNREIAEEMLRTTKVEIDSVTNGKEALEQFQKVKEGYYNLIFMDVQMPIMDGYEASKEIRSLKRKDAATIPIVAMTANAFTEDIAASRSAGMNEHITKPLNMEELMLCMNHWLS